MYIKYSHLIPQVYLTVRKAQLKQHLMIDMSDGDQQCFSLIVDSCCVSLVVKPAGRCRSVNGK